MEGTERDYAANTDGTANLLQAIREVTSVERVIITSTQHVRAPGSGEAVSETDFVPYMLYGQSKAKMEVLTRESRMQCTWTIIRPTVVWGPGHKLLAAGLWGLMYRGKYFHPANDPVLRSYGYVKNVVWQIEQLLLAPQEAVNGRVFYVADGNVPQRVWVNAISNALVGHGVREVPLWFIRGLALVGDCARSVGLRFPMYSARLKNLITQNPVPVKPTLDLLGMPPFTLEAGARETATWFKESYLKDSR
jgi:nucleoside-diphosphate-sugar epimerase